MKSKITKKNISVIFKPKNTKEKRLVESLRDKTEQHKEDTKLDKNSLNPRQEKFCQVYATDTEFFGNGVASYIEVYKPDMTKKNWYNSARASAARMLSNVTVFTRINSLLESDGFNDVNSDKQLLFLINQHADFGNKLGSIREYNKLKQRITEKVKLIDGGFLSALHNKDKEKE